MPVNHSRPSIDISFASAAQTFGRKMVGVVLSGANKDGAMGLKEIKDAGGLTIVQDPDDCQVRTMTEAAINTTKVDYVYSSKKIIDYLIKLNNL